MVNIFLQGGIVLFVILIALFGKTSIPLHQLQSNELYAPVYGYIQKIENKDAHQKITFTTRPYAPIYCPVSGTVVESGIRNLMWDSHPQDRVVELNLSTINTNSSVTVGDKIGTTMGTPITIKFSSRYTLGCKEGDRVQGPHTHLATFI